jgi:hypothetical protein
MTSIIIPFQVHLSPALPTVVGNVDYQIFRQQLDRVNQLIEQCEVEKQFVILSTEMWLQQNERFAKLISAKQQRIFQQQSRKALRCNIAHTLIGESYRDFSARLADSPVLQKFCLLDHLECIKVPGKSTLQRYANWLPAQSMREIINPLLMQAGIKADLAKRLDIEAVFMDTTCVKANIHFPVDWVLLRDGVRTLMKAVDLIRGQGLKHRMEDPEQFIRDMNRMSIGMTMTRRKADGKKARKKVLRRMKRMVKRVEDHAKRHYELLSEQWQKTEWTEKEARQVLSRIQDMLEKLPKARKQAHERIIGERMVKNEDKTLSLYDKDVHVIVRGKADAEIEFGNMLLLAENRQGVIVDYYLWRESAPADSKMVDESLNRIMAITGNGVPPQVKSVAADRGFDSAKTRKFLSDGGIYNAICPRSPAVLKQRMQEEEFVDCQQRRSQTEARIGIFKNKFLGRPLKAKGFERRELAVAWSVLTHNLWVIARMPLREEAANEPKAA